MDVTILGSGGPLPDPDRAGPSTLVQAGGRALLFDCGRGVLMRTAAVGVPSTRLSAVFLTHLHSDHVTDFNDVMTSRWVATFAPMPLTVVGPVGTQDFCDRTKDLLHLDIGYRLAHHADLTWEPEFEVTESNDGVVFDDGLVKVTAAPTDHRPVAPTAGFRVEADDQVVAIAGDTVPCEGLDTICRDADVYIQTVIRQPLVEAIPVPRLQEIHDYHSNTEDAGRTAAKNGVAKLVLNHPVPTPVEGDEQDWIDDAAAHFDGEIVLAHDLMKVLG